MEYRLDYQDAGKPITVLVRPGRDAAIRKARKLTSGNDRIVYVIASAAGADVGQRSYAYGRLDATDGDRI